MKGEHSFLNRGSTLYTHDGVPHCLCFLSKNNTHIKYQISFVSGYQIYKSNQINRARIL